MKTTARRTACAAALMVLVAPAAAWATTFQTEYSFHGGGDGASPQGRLALAPNGLFYGTTVSGGAGGGGTIFSIDPASGQHVVLHSFTNDAFGETPAPGLVVDKTGALYGVTEQAGSTSGCNLGCGTVFRFDPVAGVLTTLHSFADGGDGAEPVGRLLMNAAQTILYGTTVRGGSFAGNCANNGCGTVFKVSTKGKNFATLHAFDVDDGAAPQSALVAGPGGTLFGTASASGAHGSGVLFQIKASGSGFAVLHDFDYHVDGAYPDSDLLRKGATIYGTTSAGGTTADATNGTIFGWDITTLTLTTLHGFDHTTDGSSPSGGLTVGAGGTLLGTTESGPGNNSGSVFQLALKSGLLTTLQTFASESQAVPEGGLTADGTGGYWGGTSFGNGTLFRIAP